MERKFFVWFCIVGSLIIAFTGCSSEIPPSSSKSEAAFTIRRCEFTEQRPNSEVRIYYPQLEDATDRFDALNTYVEQQVTSFAKTTYGTTYTDVELDMDFQVFTSPQTLSIVFSGLGNKRTAAHPNNLLFSINYSLADRKVLQLSDMCAVDLELALLVENNIVEQHSAEKVQIFFADYPNATKILEALLLCDKQKGFYSYCTEQYVVISFPVRHVGGDHLEIQLRTNDLKG